ncbi:MAG: ADP-ribosylglycohydrolase [Methanosaeta sp. PtaU1.Bin112]|nr:MAG: ADP-ribosylglycohydrolase [Methanosaeta sp. PtaU1.Bin112]
MKNDLLRRLLAGLAAGDSLGSTSEFVAQREVPGVYHRMKGQGWPFKQVGGGHAGWNPGDPTDDTEMAFCMVRSFVRRGRFDPQDVAQEFVSWMRNGPIDIGTTTLRTLLACEGKDNYWEGGLHFWRENPRYAANGSLMRNGIVPGMAENLEDAFSFTLKQGMITHYAPLPQICCLAQTYLIWNLLKDKKLQEDWVESFEVEIDEYFQEIRDAEIRDWFDNVGENDAYRRSLEKFRETDWEIEQFDPFSIDYERGIGYCLLTLKIAIWGLHWSLEPRAREPPEGFPPEVFEAEGPARLAWVAMIGHDSDTYAAVAGALIAAAHPELPTGFISGLKALEHFDQLVKRSE